MSDFRWQVMVKIWRMMRGFHAKLACFLHAFRVEICRIWRFSGATDEKLGRKARL